MRRLAVMVILAGTSGCGDAFRAHVDTVAEVGQSTLAVNRLAEIVAAARELPVQREVVDLLARRWIELTVLAHRIGGGDSLTDSTLILAAMWPEVRQAVVDSFHTLLIADKVHVQPAQVDSAYRAGNMRYVAHILRRVTPETTAEEREQKRAEAQRIFERLAGGESWQRLNDENEDEVAKRRDGGLGVIVRGNTVPRFENVAFALPPGQISEVTETSFGFHIIFRPELEDVRVPFARAVEQTMVARLDSLYEQELLEAKGVEVPPTAAAAIREVARDPTRARKSEKVLASYEGGRFVVRDFVRWLRILPAQVVQGINTAPDEQLELLTRSLVTQELIWRQADSAGIELSEELYEVIAARYVTQLSQLAASMGLQPDSLALFPPAQRREILDLMVTRYLELAAANPQRSRAVPPFLAEQLLEDVRWKIHSSGVARVLERAQTLRRTLGSSPTSPRPGEAND